MPSTYQRSVLTVIEALESRAATAGLLSEQHLQRFPNDRLSIALAAEAASLSSAHGEAIAFYEQLPRDGGRWEFLREWGLGRRYAVLARLHRAEQHLRRAVSLSPYHLPANDLLGHLLQSEGRVWEAAPHFFVQIQHGKCRGDELLGTAIVERFFREDARLESKGAAHQPPEVLVNLAIARRLLFKNSSEPAETLLRQLVDVRPNVGEAQGRLGRIIVDRGDLREFLIWRGSLPDEARDHPEVWFVQGLAARRMGQMPGAARCFLEALERSPNHLAANVQIAGCLEQLGHSDAAREFSRRGELLADLEGTLNAMRGSSDPEPILRAVNQLAALGRYWEAAGWCYVLMQMGVTHELLGRDGPRYSRLAAMSSTPSDPGQLPSRLLQRRDFPLPQWPWPDGQPPSISSPVPTASARWHFVNDAERLGIGFQYYEGTTEDTRMQHIFNTMGGGLAALDYDVDGWPDLYLAQANNWRDAGPQPEHIDRLFRNVAGAAFVDRTAESRLGDDSFSHGATVGDFNQDGFPDLHIGNKGPNRLYRNNGDGTYTDVTASAGVAGNEWSTSAVFADLNADCLPDLYVLNYSPIEETARKECVVDGKQRACTPDTLPAEDDRCYINQGDGTFRDVSSVAGILAPNGRGLGVVAWDYAGDGRVGLFIGNDTSANFFFVNRGADAQGVPQFHEEALVRGVALDLDGNALASMGIAAGDITGDGRIDLFITNFFAASNVLFCQREDGFFDDLTRSLQLRDAGFWMLGFGCQFADFDGDGWEDLIVSNGHVDQRSSRGDPDRMPPQLFQNQGGKQFVEVPAAELGSYFAGRYLGRGLAILDWNRDGLTDFAVSHLHAPFALVTNQTTSLGQPLVVRLIGRNGCREPIGATVRMRTPSGEVTRLQTGGDGFLVTNEHRLHFSPPAAVDSVELEVQWPGRKSERWTAVPTGCDVLLVEGRAEPVILRRFSSSPAQ